MKRLFVVSIFFLSSLSWAMYYQGGKLENTEIKLTNKSAIPLEVSWIEVRIDDREGRPVAVKHVLNPGETKDVKIGEVGGYVRGDKSTLINYYPIQGNNNFKQSFLIDLPKSNAFAFTAVKLADIVNNVWVPGVFQADKNGNFGSFQYMNLQHPSQWENVLLEAGKVKEIK